MRMLMAVLMIVVMFMAVLMAVLMIVAVFVAMLMIVRMVMPVLLALLFSADKDVQVRADDTALLRGMGVEHHSGNAQSVELGENGLAVVKELQKARGEHIARRAHGTVKMQYLHARLSM